jgi:hypothetical protein
MKMKKGLLVIFIVMTLLAIYNNTTTIHTVQALDEYYCFDDNTFFSNVTKKVCYTDGTSITCEDIAIPNLEVCQWGCDMINMQCRSSPLETGALFICFILYMAAISITPILILTHHTTKKKRDAVFGFFTLFFAFVVYAITTVYIIPAIANNFGSDYYVTVILVGMTIIVFPIIDVLLIFNNIIKDRY